MEIIKKNLVVIVLVLVLLVLILIRSTGVNHFKSNAKSLAEPSVIQSNMITYDKVSTLAGEKLFINMSGDMKNAQEFKAINISPDSILIKKYFNPIMKHDGPVILYSSEPGISARIWMLLSQMGRTSIFILANSSDNEILKYKFVPDSLSN